MNGLLLQFGVLSLVYLRILHYSTYSLDIGDISSITVFGQPLIIINSLKIALDLLDKKSSIYSDRPILQMGGELVGWKNTLVLLPYGDRFRRYRKLFHRSIGSINTIRQFQPIQSLESRRFLRKLLSNPQNLQSHIRKTAGAIILRISHGYDVKDIDDPFVQLADTATEQFSLATAPGNFLVDLLPARTYLPSLSHLTITHLSFSVRHVPDWFPGAIFKKTAKEWSSTLCEMVDRPYNFVKQQMVTNHISLSKFSILNFPSQ